MYTKETAILKNLFSVFNKELFQGKLNPIEIVVLSNIDMIFADPNPILYDMDGHYFGDLGIEEVDELLSDDEKLAQFVGDDVYYLGYFNGSEDPPKIYINIELFT